jgi:hypothetical protein
MSIANLISTLEGATAPCLELDADIAIVAGWTFEKMKGDAKPYWRKPGETSWFTRAKDGPPRYTASIDAALTLVPEGMSWGVFNRNAIDDASAWVWRTPERDLLAGINATSKSEAIALCIAALKARQAASLNLAHREQHGGGT